MRSRATRRALLVARSALAPVIVAMTVACAPAAAAEKAIWGPAVTLPDGGSAMALYDELGVDTLELSLNWSDVAARRPAAATDPADPAYRWPAEIAHAEAEAASRGMQLALLVANAPGWSNGARAPIWAPREPRDYADFVVAAARRYPSVRRWMIWGEPNRADRFRPNRDASAIGPRAYARLLDAAYAALKRESPANRVIGGMTWTSGTLTPTRFLRLMRLPSGRRPRLDWFGHNPFPFRFPKLSATPIDAGIRDISDSDTFSREIASAYGRRVPLWLSEFTIQSERGSSQFATFVSRPAQARYVTAAFKLADDLAGAVAGLGWLALLDEPPAPASANFGLLTYALARKPAAEAFARAPSARLAPAVQVAPGTTRATLRGAGLAVRVTPRAAGAIVVELRLGERRMARAQSSGRPGSTATLRLRSSLRQGRYVVAVRAARAVTVRRALRVR
jgi:hypothetical protein